MKLSLNCEATYEDNFLSPEESSELFNHLIDSYHIDQEFLRMNVPGLDYVSKFGKISFTDQVNIESHRFPEQSYGKMLEWDTIMQQLKSKVENHANAQFGMCVCLYYPDGHAGVDFHSDLIAFGNTDIIPSISLGAERTFILRNKNTHEEYQIALEKGSILIMGKHCQSRYAHSLPLDPNCSLGRINLTFRKVFTKT